jgi:lysophospholipase L1-like esterase
VNQSGVRYLIGFEGVNDIGDVIDFDTAVRDPVTLTNYQAAVFPGANANDWLYMNPLGDKTMADAIDLTLFSLTTIVSDPDMKFINQNEKKNSMKKLISVVAGVVLSAFLTPAQTAPGAATAQTNPASEQPAGTAVVIPAPPRPNAAIIPQLNRGFMRAHSNFVAIAEKGDIDVLFMGDSITDWWRSAGRGQGANGVIPLGGKAVFEKHFGSMKVANFGIAGDTTQGVLWRLQNGEGRGYKPKAVMLMLGTNNTGRNSPPEIAMGVANVVFELRKNFPEAKILLLAIFPRSGPESRVRAQIAEINQMISALHDNQHVFYMDINSKFLAADGSIPQDIMSDGLHPTSKGYEIWAEAVRDTLVSYLK